MTDDTADNIPVFIPLNVCRTTNIGFFRHICYICQNLKTNAMKKPLLLAALVLSLGIIYSCHESENPLSDDFEQLDITLERMGEYVSLKEQKIAAIEGLLHSDEMPDLQKYHIYGQLYEEYVAFQFDKAKEMLECQEAIAKELGDRSRLNSAYLKKAMLYTTAGMFLEANHVFEQLDTTEFDYHQKISWYDARQKFLHDYSEYVRSSGITVPGTGNIRSYQDKILANTPENSSLCRHIRIMRLIEARRFEEAYDENMKIIETLNADIRDYAVQTYWQGFICENLQRDEEAVRWWIKSAMCDVRAAIKDNASLSSIALKLINPEDTDRAFRYLRISLDDALYYNAKLRKVQIASAFPLVEKAYYESQIRQRKVLGLAMAVLFVLAVLFMLFAVFAMRLHIKGKRSAKMIEAQNRRLAESFESIAQAEAVLKKTNMELTEANAAKEEYLGLFLSMCSGYLDKLKKTISREQYESELRNFYKTIDTSFLQLYPTFVDDFNSLLKEEARVTLKDGELLNTELRIFALIKLGINQSLHIASLLRYSVNTIYNYRAQVKNSVKGDRENFENMVRKIGSRH